MALFFYAHNFIPIKKAKQFCFALSDPTGARTQDPNIKSVVLYQLSYRVFRNRLL